MQCPYPIEIGNHLYWPFHSVDVNSSQNVTPSPHCALICLRICDQDFDFIFAWLDQLRDIQPIGPPHQSARMRAVHIYVRNRAYAPEVQHDSLVTVALREVEGPGIDSCSGEIGKPGPRPWFE